MQVSRRQAEALIRTSISAVSNDTRMATFRQNSEVIKGIQQLSTLDGRTTVICIAYSNKMWTLDGVPIGHTLPFNNGLPRHWGERSHMVPITKSWAELSGLPLKQANGETLDRLFQENLRKRGWSEERIATARRNQQASMDGQVPADRSYQDFLRSKGKDFQNEVLGPTRADLFRRGVITDTSALVSQDGNPLTVRALKQRFGIQDAA